MQQRCEVCENFRPEGDLESGRPLVEVTFGERRVLLCRGHAGIAQSSGVESLDALRELYSESNGQRSYVPRRARSNPMPAPASERNAGRRASDQPN